MKKDRVQRLGDLAYIPLSRIEPPLFMRDNPDDREYLEDSVRERGSITPIVVRKLDNGNFRIIDGYGRFIKAKERNDTTILARVVELESDEDEILLNIELNQTKRNLSLKEILRAISILRNKGFTNKQIQEKLKLSKSSLYRYLWISEFPEQIQDLFLMDIISLRVADSIHKLPQDLREELARRLLRTGFSTSQSENSWKVIRLCDELLEQQEEQKEIEKPMETPHEVEEEKPPMFDMFEEVKPTEEEEKAIEEHEKEGEEEHYYFLEATKPKKELMKEEVSERVIKISKEAYDKLLRIKELYKELLDLHNWLYDNVDDDFVVDFLLDPYEIEGSLENLKDYLDGKEAKIEIIGEDNNV